MENLNYKLAGLRDTVKKIKKEIKSFEENESKNIQKRTNTVSNKLFRPLSNYKKAPPNKLNKRLMKNYFKLSLKEQNYYNYKNTKEKFKNIMTPHQLNKDTHRVKPVRSSQTSKNRFDNKGIVNNGGTSKENNAFIKKYMVMTDINNHKITHYNENDKDDQNDSCMNKNLIKYITTRNKEFARKKKEINKNMQYDRAIMTYSNNDLKKNIFNSYYIKNKIKNKNNNKDLLYNEYNNYNINNNENIFKNMNNSANYNNNKRNNKKINISDLFNIGDIDEQSHSNKNIINNNLFKFNNSKLNMKKNNIKDTNKNNSYNGKTKLYPNLNQINKNLKKENKKDKLNYIKNDFHCDSYRSYLLNNEANNTYANNLFKFHNNILKDYTSMQEYFNYNTKPKNFAMNNTINYISNDSDIDIYFKKNDKNKLNKNKMKNIIGNNSIGDIYIKAKLFEKCGEKNFNNYVNNNCETNDLICNLKKYINYLIQIKEEENQYKRQINMYQRLCKGKLELMNPKQINDILSDIQENFIENEENDSYIVEQIKSILPY